ncbi:MAG: DUF2789 domain-containing protein [Proteobacteria bacterium]|nr:DUF2789 domain-containing protein [Pseudomonadota bacterium]RTL35359.1 MAG: DUF2789 domain-containing protein [Rhodocyclaceae bacterium]
MESHIHNIANLFAQLGLPSESSAIDAFIAAHAPLPHDVPLSEAPFWSPVQAAFLKNEIAEDADWSAVIDTLDVQLRQSAEA